MKENIRKEYFNRLREMLKSELNAKHVFQEIKTWMVVPSRWCLLFDIVLVLLNGQNKK